jgi:hypothetical protein
VGPIFSTKSLGENLIRQGSGTILRASDWSSYWGPERGHSVFQNGNDYLHAPKQFFVEENAATNVAISLYTTSAARLRLLGAMEKVVKSPGAEILYTNT